MQKLVADAAAGAQTARDHALAVLRTRGTALAIALLPAAAAVVLLTAGATGRIGDGWRVLRWTVVIVALVVLLSALGVAAVVARARPAISPTVPLDERSAPELYRLVRDLADRLDVPAPSALALTPDCDSWLEDRTHATSRVRAGRGLWSRRRSQNAAADAQPSSGSASLAGAERQRAGGGAEAPVLVIGSPFLWWMRVAELRALLAPVVAGTGPSGHPDIAAARRFVRGLDAALAVAAAPPAGGPPGMRGLVSALGRALQRPALLFVGWVARLLLRGCGPHASEMERGVAAAASARAQTVDYGLRIVAQEQVGLAYAGWDRLLIRVALPAWRTGRWPSRLNAGVVSALTELSRRDRLADSFSSRLGERPACDLLEEPGAVDEAVSLLAARLFYNASAEPGPDWSPVGWSEYPEEVVDRIWRTEAARLFAALDATPPGRAIGDPLGVVRRPEPAASAGSSTAGPPAFPVTVSADEEADTRGPTLARVVERLAVPQGADALAARISAEITREEAARGGTGPAAVPGDVSPMGFPPQLPRSGRELLAEHVLAAVRCAAADTAMAVPGLDWLDGPVLMLDGQREGAREGRPDVAGPVGCLVEDGDPRPLRDWMVLTGVRPDKPVRLI